MWFFVFRCAAADLQPLSPHQDPHLCYLHRTRQRPPAFLNGTLAEDRTRYAVVATARGPYSENRTLTALDRLDEANTHGILFRSLNSLPLPQDIARAKGWPAPMVKRRVLLSRARAVLEEAVAMNIPGSSPASASPRVPDSMIHSFVLAILTNDIFAHCRFRWLFRCSSEDMMKESRMLLAVAMFRAPARVALSRTWHPQGHPSSEQWRL